jgi:ribose transport system permease protein
MERDRSPGLQAALVAVRLGPLVVLLVVALVFALLSPFFLTKTNLQNLFIQSSVVGALALGQLLVILTRGIDLSQGSTLAMTTVLGAAIAGDAAGSAGVVIPVMLLGGAAVGLVNGLVLVKLRLGQPFIVTLGMLSIARGIALLISDGEAVTGMPDVVRTAGSGFLGPIPVPALVVIGVGLLAFGLTKLVRWGAWVYAVGGEPEAARRMGIPVDRVLISVYVLSGVAAAVGGIITAGRTNSGYPTAGSLAELDAISAVIIGGASFFGGRGSVWNALVGALILGTIRNGLNLMNVSPNWQLVAIGSIVILAVAMDAARTRLEGRLRTAQSELDAVAA